MNQKTTKTKRPVGRPRADGRSHLTKKDVFRAAAKLMCVFGFTGTSVRMIAQELDCTTASIFNLFATKKDLFDELISSITAKAFEFYAELMALDPEPGEAVFKSLFEDSLVLGAAPVEFIAIYELPELRHPDFGHARRLRRRLVSHYDNLIADGVARGEFHPCDARWMAEQMIQLVETCIMAGDQFTHVSLRERCLETARFGLRGILVNPDRLPKIEAASEALGVTYSAPTLS